MRPGGRVVLVVEIAVREGILRRSEIVESRAGSHLRGEVRRPGRCCRRAVFVDEVLWHHVRARLRVGGEVGEREDDVCKSVRKGSS